MQRRQHTIFTTVRSEGAILPADLLTRIATNDPNLPGLTPDSYNLLKSEKLNEAINRSWNRLLNAWGTFKSSREKLPEKDAGTTLTRERWLLPLFAELGYGRLLTTRAIEVNDKSYAISHGWQHTPIHLVSFKVDLDQYSRSAAGAARNSPHSLVQELLNRSEEHLWGIVSNGLRLRVLRNNASLTRQAYVEFDLEAMMSGEVYADFALLWLLCHQSRVEAERPAECWLEKWSRTALEQGTRALDQLRNGVEKAITALGGGFLAHPANSLLREKLRSGALNQQDYYRQVLRLVYRLIVLFVAEDREILFHPASSEIVRERYSKYYSTGRLRLLAEQRVGTRHADLFAGLRLVMEALGGALGNDNGCPELGLPALNSFLFSRDAVVDIVDCEIANRDLLDAIRSLALTNDRYSRRVVDYKNLGAEELGSVYESLLELHPVLHIEAEQQPDPETAILNLKVCDPACGSGHFLIAAAHRIARRLASIRTGVEEPAPTERRKALRDVVGRCIYGVDINPMSVELCKVSLWMEAIEPGKPLSFLEQHIQCGNSLLGATPALLANGIPDSAFEAIEGDNKKICSEYKKKNKYQREGNRTLFDPEGQPWERLGDLASSMMQLDDMRDDTVEDIHRKQDYYEQLVKSSGYEFGRLWADAWCAAFVWKKTGDFAYPITEDVFRNIEKNPHNIASWMKAEIIRLRDQYQFFHWHLAFPDVFRVPTKDEEPENEQAGWSGGFDVVLGNPPWERIKIQEKEWFAQRNPDIANAANAAQRRRMIAALQYDDPATYNAFMEDQRQATGESHIVRDSGRYPLCGRGDVNTYTIFAETMRLVISPTGRVGCIVPSGIATDDTTKFFFQDMVDSHSLVSLFAFENEAKLFPGIDHRMKFALLTVAGNATYVSESEFAFGLYRSDDLNEEDRHFSLSAKDIALLNPNTRTCPIFRSKRDMILTNDSHLFRTLEQLEAEGWTLEGNIFYKDNEAYLPLYEGKMIWHFDYRFGTYDGQTQAQANQGKLPELAEQQHADPLMLSIPHNWIHQSHLPKSICNGRNAFLVFRDITNASVLRTAIFCLIPVAPCGNNLPIAVIEPSYKFEVLYLSTCTSSFVFDYVARQTLGGTHMNFFILKQLPVLPPKQYAETCTWDNKVSLGDWIIPRALELTYTAWDLEPFAKDCGYDGPPFRWDDRRRFLLRCELDAAYFHLYGIERDDVDYIMETFRVWKQNDEKEFGEYRTKRVILEVFDEMRRAMERGEAYRTRLAPPPADRSVAHEERKGAEV